MQVSDTCIRCHKTSRASQRGETIFVIGISRLWGASMNADSLWDRGGNERAMALTRVCYAGMIGSHDRILLLLTC
jgi:hypothetical protein